MTSRILHVLVVTIKPRLFSTYKMWKRCHKIYVGNLKDWWRKHVKASCLFHWFTQSTGCINCKSHFSDHSSAIGAYPRYVPPNRIHRARTLFLLAYVGACALDWLIGTNQVMESRRYCTYWLFINDYCITGSERELPLSVLRTQGL